MEKPKERILNCLKRAKIPQGVENIRTACDIGNWNTALKHCLELLLEGRIKGQKTSKSWVFWIEQEAEK
ncbi:MAG: hypothetical protein ACP5ER_05325 [Candidatus Bathyarchaeales archaeon]